jgi:LAO/AO transport system kinase
MGGRALDPGVYIRSVANRAHAGGLSRTAARLITALDAAGYGTILLETVGAGQSEVEVAALAQSVLVVLAPGFGDEVQALKAGILETADLFVVNKADLPGADRVAAALHTEAAPRRGERPQGTGERPVLLVSAGAGTGVTDLVAAIDAQHASSSSADSRERRRARARWLLEEAARDAMWERYARQNKGALAAMAERVLAGEMDAESAAHALIARYSENGKPDP